MLDQHEEKYEFNKISVIGLGYIGLPTAAVIASRKIEVIGVDISKDTVDIINQGRIHIVEPELDIVVHAVVSEGYLKATTEPQSANAFLIAVPTPLTESNQPDLSYIEAAAKSIAPVLNKGNLVILESTSPVGATEQMSAWLALARPDLTFPLTHGDKSDIRIAYCPERVLPGHVLRELVGNDRVIGGLSAKCSNMASRLYKLFVDGDCFITNARTAEMCKLTENSFRDVNIAFANELSIVCDKLNINVWDLLKLANLHPRVNILRPGPGVGGHCIAVDPWFIVNSTPEQAKLIRTAREVNMSKPLWVIDKIKNEIDTYLHSHPHKTKNDILIACFGLTFKANIDDLRESPSLEIVRCLAEIYSGYIMVVEPHITHLPKGLPSGVELTDQEIAFAEADILIMLVNHKKFHDKSIQFRSNLKIIDVCGAWAEAPI